MPRARFACLKTSQAWLQDVLSILFLLWLPMWLPNEFWYVNPVCGKTVKKKFEVADTIKELVLESYSYTIYMYGLLLLQVVPGFVCGPESSP